MSTEDILAERGKSHGSFPEQAAFSQSLKELLLKEPLRTGRIDVVQTEGLEMIAVKLSRIVCGNPAEPDHWADIAGYARLVADHLERMAKKPDGEDDFRHSPEQDDVCPDCGVRWDELHRHGCPARMQPMAKNDGEENFRRSTDCPDCGVQEGEHHRPGCPRLQSTMSSILQRKGL